LFTNLRQISNIPHFAFARIMAYLKVFYSRMVPPYFKRICDYFKTQLAEAEKSRRENNANAQS
jgi:hypothetical protein